MLGDEDGGNATAIVWDSKGGKRMTAKKDEDDRPEAQALFRALRSSLPQLEELLRKHSGHRYEDHIYRFYHQSFKVYDLQESTLEIVQALRALAPERELNRWFSQIVEQGTGKAWECEHNQKWLEVTRPILEGFFHARYFLEMGIQHGKTLSGPPNLLPSGWAAFLYLYDLR